MSKRPLDDLQILTATDAVDVKLPERYKPNWEHRPDTTYRRETLRSGWERMVARLRARFARPTEEP